MAEIIWDHEMAAYVRTRLFEWADYYLQKFTTTTKYANTLKRHLLREGVLLQMVNEHDEKMTGDQAAAEMEAYLQEMAYQYPKITKALRCYYKQSTTQAKLNELQQLGLNLTPDAFQHYVDLGHCWLAGRLTFKAVSKNAPQLAA